MPRFTDPKLLWEEPFQTLAENITITRALNGHILLDTCLTDLNAYEEAIAAGVEAVAIKPAFLDGRFVFSARFIKKSLDFLK